MPEKRLGFAICCYSDLHSRCGRPACDAGAASPAEISPSFPQISRWKKGEKNDEQNQLVMTNIAMENPNHKWRFSSLGKSSISIRAIEKPWRTVSHNQRVISPELSIKWEKHDEQNHEAILFFLAFQPLKIRSFQLPEILWNLHHLHPASRLSRCPGRNGGFLKNPTEVTMDVTLW